MADENLLNNGPSGFTSLSSLPSYRNTSYLQKIKQMDTTSILRYMRYLNVVLAMLQGLAGFMGLFDLVTLNITSFLISVYVIIFALLLLAFECRFQSMEKTIRENFGFLYTYRGRVVFIFFVGFLDFGMSNSMGWVAGVLMCLNAVLNLIVLLCHPSFQTGELDATMDPTCGYNTGEQEASSLLAQNPEIARQAGNFAFQQAQKNPEYAVKMATSFANEAGKQNASGYSPPNPIK